MLALQSDPEQVEAAKVKPMMHPHIQVNCANDGYSIVCEQIQVAMATDVPEAWCLLIVAYFVYDMKFP